MGCCNSRTVDEAITRRTPRSGKRVTNIEVNTPPFVPGPVRNLKMTLIHHDSQSPSMSVTWCCPENCTSYRDIKNYHIDIIFTRPNDSIISSADDDVYRLNTFTTLGNVMKLRVDRKDGLLPLVSYTVEVRAESQEGRVGQKAEDTIFIRWHCQLPGCNENRTVMNPECTALLKREIYNFCSLTHKNESDQKYCLYPECTNKKDPSLCSVNAKYPTASKSHFCNKDHQSRARNEGLGFFIEVEPTSQEFQTIKKKFKKKWSSKKGQCPLIVKVLAVVNPALEDSLKEYKKSLSLWHSKTKKYFHGTGFKCRLDLYQTPCKRGNCGICGVSREGFQREHVRERWQRYGKGFYFAPNSSKSNDYCSKPDDAKLMAMLLCQVAPGKEHTSRKNMSDLKKPPKGCDSVHGKSKSLLFRSVLNYDEIVVFNGDAVCPRYVLLYKH